ncbi:hypothetical protein ACVME8_002978 [Bradyrhizobium diazoefficiens]
MISAFLNEQDRASLRVVHTFLNDRLEEASTVGWAVRLGAENRIERLAIEDLLSGPGARQLSEPWATAWRLIEESWSERPIDKGSSTAIYFIQGRLRAGDRSGSVISAIVDLVAPRLKVGPVGTSFGTHPKTHRRPKSFRDLLSAKLSSGDLVDLDVLELDRIQDVAFLSATAEALESALNHGLDIGRRIGWDGWSRLWQLGDLYRVNYVVRGGRRADGTEDPDAYHHGIAPSVKLLFAIFSRIASLELERALPFTLRWRAGASAIHLRLWAAAAKAFDVASTSEIAKFLTETNDHGFWDLNSFPEVADLRASRFREMDLDMQKVLADRLAKGPPRSLWPRKAEPERVKGARLYSTVRELERVRVAGGNLPDRARKVLAANILSFRDLWQMSPDEGFPEGPVVRDVHPATDDRYHALDGVARLQALETTLAADRVGWDNDPAGRADNWLRQPENASLVLHDLETAERGGEDFPRVWERFGWTHSPSQPQGNGATNPDLQHEADRVLGLLSRLPEKTLRIAIEGISNWLDRWATQVVACETGYMVWFKVWPIAVQATNDKREDEGDDAESA